MVTLGSFWRCLLLLLAISLATFGVPRLAFSQEGSFTHPDAQMAASAPAMPSTQAAPAANTDNLPLAVRVARLERQQAYYNSLGLPQAMNQLRDQLQRLRGQLDDQAHQLQVLQTQQNKFYQDLNQRLQALSKQSASRVTAATQSPQAVSNNLSVSASASTLAGTTDAKKQASENAYQQAFSALSQKKYADAETAFKHYLTDYPTGQYRPNCYYWLGEIYLLHNRLPEAATAFNTVVTKFPQSTKVADAELKLAMTRIRQGNTLAAKSLLEKTAANYPGTTAAQLADVQLKQLSQIAK